MGVACGSATAGGAVIGITDDINASGDTALFVSCEKLFVWSE